MQAAGRQRGALEHTRSDGGRSILCRSSAHPRCVRPAVAFGRRDRRDWTGSLEPGERGFLFLPKGAEHWISRVTPCRTIRVLRSGGGERAVRIPYGFRGGRRLLRGTDGNDGAGPILESPEPATGGAARISHSEALSVEFSGGRQRAAGGPNGRPARHLFTAVPMRLLCRRGWWPGQLVKRIAVHELRLYALRLSGSRDVRSRSTEPGDAPVRRSGVRACDDPGAVARRKGQARIAGSRQRDSLRRRGATVVRDSMVSTAGCVREKRWESNAVGGLARGGRDRRRREGDREQCRNPGGAARREHDGDRVVPIGYAGHARGGVQSELHERGRSTLGRPIREHRDVVGCRSEPDQQRGESTAGGGTSAWPEAAPIRSGGISSGCEFLKQPRLGDARCAAEERLDRR